MNPEIVRSALDQYVLTQPWWKKYSNTITGAWTGLLIVAWFTMDSQADLPSWVTYVVGGLLYAGQMLGLAKTPNGVTPAVVDKVTTAVEQRYGRHAARD